MFKAYKYRLYPTKEQEVLLNKHFGAVRFVYNLALETREEAYKSNKRTKVSAYDLQGQLKDLKKDCKWLKEINSQSLQSAIMNLDSAYQNFFKGRSKFPIFKKKSSHQSFQCPQNVRVNFETQTISLPKFKHSIKIVLSRQFDGIVKAVTITKTPTNKYFANIMVDTNEEPPTKKPIQKDTAVGIDLGIKTFAVLSDGTTYKNPKCLKKSLDRLKILQKRADKKKKGSQNHKKALQKVARLYEKVTNQRQDFLHKTSTAITKRYDTIAIEDLTVSNMIKNHKLAQSISDCGWGEFRRMLTYKSDWQGKNLKVIGRFEPSSKTCSVCGEVNQELTLAAREWTCAGCGTCHDRDLNAALNILKAAL